MLKFFRRIRQELIEKGNLKRYLIYSVGEILFIVIGILIALEMNNWNDSRKESNFQKLYLENLISELDKQIDYYDFIVNAAENIKINIDHVFDLINDPSSTVNEIRAANDSITLVLGNITPLSNKFWDLTTSGKVDILEDEIRNHILQYYRLLELNFQIMNERIKLARQYRDDWLSQIDFAHYKGKLIAESSLSKDWLKDKNSLAFLKMTNFHMFRYDNIEYIQDGIRRLKNNAQSLKKDLSMMVKNSK